MTSPNPVANPPKSGTPGRVKAREAMTEARKAAVERRAAEMPPKCRSLYLRAVAGRCPPRAAIKSHCLECCGWDRRAVAECTGLGCPLWTYRPRGGA
jgi:hypothetical protein